MDAVPVKRLPYSWNNVHEVTGQVVQLLWPWVRIGGRVYRVGVVRECEDGDLVDWGDDDDGEVEGAV